MMLFKPIPTDRKSILTTAPMWLRFLPDIAKRSHETLEEIMGYILRHDVQIGVVWDNEKKEATALIGMQFKKQGDEFVGELRWVTGRGAKDWQHLIKEVEKYFRHLGCHISRPLCRPGWAPMLKQHGYRTTHYVMERRL